MLSIQKTVENGAAFLRVAGRLDTVTSPELQQALDELGPAIKEMTLDLAELDYVSSAGLRVLVSAQKRMKEGSVKLLNPNETLLEILDVTGLSQFLTILPAEEEA